MKREECIKKIERYIPDPNVRECIFCGDNHTPSKFLTSRNEILKYFSNIFNVVFLFIYAKYKVWTVEDAVLESTPTNLLRVFEELKNVYSKGALTFDIIENMLVDIQLDIATGGEICKELRMENSIIKNDKFTSYAYKAKKARMSSRLSDDVPIDKRYDELIDLIQSFRFLRDLSFELKNVDNVSLYMTDGTKIPLNNVSSVVMDLDCPMSDKFNRNLNTNFTIICKSGKYYCLEMADNIMYDGNDGELLLNYWQIGSLKETIEVHIVNNPDKLKISKDSFVISYETAWEDYSAGIIGLGGTDNEECDSEEEYKISNFYAINYKYVKILALAISDIMRDSTRKAIAARYGQKHNFQQTDTGARFNGKGRTADYTWSEVISLLMMEEGATKILTFLMSSDPRIKDELLANLEFRFGSEQFSKHKVNKAINEAKVKLKKQEVSEYVSQTEENDKEAEICARKTIIAISKAMNGNKMKPYNSSFPLSIRLKIIALEEIKNSSDSLPKKIGILKRIIVQTFKTLYGFYYGFFEYYKVKKDFDNESFYKSLSLEEIDAYQRKAEEKFKDRVNKVKALVKDEEADYKKLLTAFREFCLQCESGTKGSEYSRSLKDALGKNKLMDVAEVDYLIKCFDNPDMTEDEFENVVDGVKAVFKYLQTGKKNRGTSLGIIFPHVATCEYTDILCDGNEVYHFTVISGKGVEKNLRVLSEFKYKHNEKYYFLPSKMSSDERLNIWIEPVLINYQIFE